MRDGIRFLATMGLALVVVIGCGGSGGTPGPAATTASSGTTATSGATAGPGATASAAAAATDQPSADGGGGATGVCALVTADELAGILGVPVTTRVLAGPPDTCDIQADGAPIAAFVLTPSGGGAVYSAYAADPAATTIPGMGDKAAYSPTAQLLVILKGDTLLSMAAFDPDKTPEERLELLKKIGAIAAGRM